MEWLAARTHDGLVPIGWEDLVSDFFYRGEKQPLKDRMQGIYKPASMEAALSITTTYRPAGAERPYDDAEGADGLMRYKWKGTNPDDSSNRALREAMNQGLPLIWFWGVAEGVYKPIYPVYLVAEEVEEHQFVVATDGLQDIDSLGKGLDEITKRYVLDETRRRLHQPVFRSLVMQAYKTSCAVCELRHPTLLDAAHIVDDSDERGIAAVRNGLAMCKIHHAAYDSGILGVTPGLEVQIREDILEEIDGPVLEYGLKRLHGQRLRVIPTRRKERPDPALLSIQYERFVSARTGKPSRVDVVIDKRFAIE